MNNNVDRARIRIITDGSPRDELHSLIRTRSFAGEIIRRRTVVFITFRNVFDSGRLNTTRVVIPTLLLTRHNKRAGPVGLGFR